MQVDLVFLHISVFNLCVHQSLLGIDPQNTDLIRLCTTPTDIDECERGSAGCDVNANCSNTEGSYVCSCILGYTGSGLMCTGRWLF